MALVEMVLLEAPTALAQVLTLAQVVVVQPTQVTAVVLAAQVLL
jgi:hypothetical protein